MNTLKAGKKMPEFSGIDQYGNEIRSKDLLGKPLIVFFYPKASTPGCTAQVCDLNNNLAQWKDLGFIVLGISADSVRRQHNFSEKYGLDFPLIADTEKSIINKFGVWGEKKFMGRTYDGIHRTTFLIDEKGKITHVIDKVKTKTHTQQILEIIKKQ
ncbi:MAG: thioredoxin-dependent thiol peroxidase [Weeksellaceae bacterium]|nr:thioredoxin-dependent thiol peroxidase [Weeksellaceae bacterium]